MKERPCLVDIQNNHTVTKEIYPEFWFQCQRAMLLGLKETGILDEVQYRYAEERLQQMSRISSQGRGR